MAIAVERDQSDVPHLRGQIARQQVDVVDQVLPRAREVFHLRLEAEPPFGSHFADDSRDARGDGAQTPHERPDGRAERVKVALQGRPVHLERHVARQVAVDQRLKDGIRGFGKTGHAVFSMMELERPHGQPPGSCGRADGGSRSRLAFGPHGPVDPVQLTDQSLVLLDQGVEGERHLSHHAFVGAAGRHPDGQVALPRGPPRIPEGTKAPVRALEVRTSRSPSRRLRLARAARVRALFRGMLAGVHGGSDVGCKPRTGGFASMGSGALAREASWSGLKGLRRLPLYSRGPHGTVGRSARVPPPSQGEPCPTFSMHPTRAPEPWSRPVPSPFHRTRSWPRSCRAPASQRTDDTKTASRAISWSRCCGSREGDLGGAPGIRELHGDRGQDRGCLQRDSRRQRAPSSQETARVCRVVGKEGKLRQRMNVPGRGRRVGRRGHVAEHAHRRPGLADDGGHARHRRRRQRRSHAGHGARRRRTAARRRVSAVRPSSSTR